MERDEFKDWMAWASIRGMFGEQRGDMRNGMLCALVKNLALAMCGQKPTAKATDFMPFHETPKADPKKQANIKAQIENLQDVLGVKEG